MKILIFNWRDIKNPEGGGAEVLTHEMAKRWVKLGNTVTQFSAAFHGSSKVEMIDGVKIIRAGSANIRNIGLPVHLAAFFWYLKNGIGNFDIVIDEIHGIPFFTTWYVRTKKIALICEVADTIWDAIFPFPLNIFGKISEQMYLQFYKNISFLTISTSTKQELIKKGISDEKITILPMGLSMPKRKFNYTKEKDPTLIFVGRLTRAKGIEVAIHAIVILKKVYPKIKLWVVGQGDSDYYKKIINLARLLKIEDRIIFFGFVNQNKKFELMGKANLLIVPSMKEGWGLTVHEAGYIGTPSVAYNVEGLRDIIIQHKTGLLVSTTPEALAKGIVRLLSDKKVYKYIQKNVEKASQNYSWDKTANEAFHKLQEL